LKDGQSAAKLDHGSDLEKVQRLSLTGVAEHVNVLAKRLPPFTGDDIVRALWKHWDTCNRLVAGSNPAGGACKILGHAIAWSLILMLPRRKTPARLSSGFERRSMSPERRRGDAQTNFPEKI